MRTATIFALLFTCLVLFASVAFTDGNTIRNRPIKNRANNYKQSANIVNPRLGRPMQNGRRQFAGRQMLEAVRQRRKVK